MPESPSPHLRDMLPMTAEGADPRLFSSRQALAGLSAVGGSGAVSPDDDDLEVHLKYKGQVYPVTMNQHTEAMEVRRPCHCRLQSAAGITLTRRPLQAVQCRALRLHGMKLGISNFTMWLDDEK